MYRKHVSRQLADEPRSQGLFPCFLRKVPGNEVVCRATGYQQPKMIIIVHCFRKRKLHLTYRTLPKVTTLRK